MSGANYTRCAKCNQKAYYDADTDYGDADWAALCPECATTHQLIVAPKENTQ